MYVHTPQKTLRRKSFAVTTPRPKTARPEGCSCKKLGSVPKFPLKGSFKGDIDTARGVDMDIDEDMAASINSRSFLKMSLY